MLFRSVREIMVDNLGLDPSEISLDSNLQDDLDIDSLDAVELALEIEEALGIKIPDEDLDEMKTVKDIVSYLESRN